ncbi:nitroreductase family protein [Lapidilactobacillus bayanensis]|uniref:nitroreductase family protein n=1 Tax=Lapidilactobacillus bayanensis TaxID=2485998 RepID=UPI000F776DD0|nr:nitroreductase family protein [Lapidilactobacillus bayanensis]
MAQLVNNDFADVMLNRHSVRKFDPSVKISRDELQEMIAQATTAPSACNLQSWHFVVIDTPEGKEQLKKSAMKFNYPQIDTSSAIIFVAGDTQSHKVYRDVWTKVYEAGKIDKAKLDSIFNTFLPLYENASPEFLTLDATIDGSMVGMQLLLAARAHGYEANAWSGYDFKTIISTLGLDEKRFVPVMAIAIGKPATGEKILKTDRYDAKTLTEFL